MLMEQYFAVSQSRTEEDFQKNLVKFADDLGFPLVNAVMVVERPGAPTNWFYKSVGNTPQGFLKVSVDPEETARDPVIRALHRSSVPFVYDQALYVANRAGHMWEVQAEHGYHTGICVALHLPDQRHFLLGLDRKDPIPVDDHACAAMLASMQLLAVHAQEAAQRVILGDGPLDIEKPRLSPREVEILHWTMDGKSTKEVADQLCISEHTVNYHLRHVLEKLNTNSKHHAVLIALKLGLL